MGVGRRVLVAHDAMDGDNGVAGSGVARVIDIGCVGCVYDDAMNEGGT